MLPPRTRRRKCLAVQVADVGAAAAGDFQEVQATAGTQPEVEDHLTIPTNPSHAPNSATAPVMWLMKVNEPWDNLRHHETEDDDQQEPARRMQPACGKDVMRG